VISYGEVEDDLYLLNVDFVNLVGTSIARYTLKLDSSMTAQQQLYQWA